MTNTGILTVQDLTTAGLISWWRLSGSLPCARLEMVWETAGLDPKLLPHPPSPKVALGRTAAAAAKQLPVKARAHPLDGARGGWAIVVQSAQAQLGSAWGSVVATLRLGDGGKLVAEIEPEYQERLAVWLPIFFEDAQQTLAVEDISAWLTWRAKELHAVALRDTGGVYFIPETDTAAYRATAAAIESASDHKLYEVPAVKTEKAVEAILAAVIAESDAIVTELETEIDTTELGPRALGSRRALCGEILTKVEKYEGLLGRSMISIRDRIEGLRAIIVEAELAASVKTA